MTERKEEQHDLFGDESLDHDAIVARLDDMQADDPRRWPQRLVECSDLLSAALMHKHEIDEPRAKRMARTLTVAIARHFGGDQFYLPTGAKLDLMIRDKSIWDEFTGRNHLDLARKHKLTVMQIYNILGRQKALHRSRVQFPLFD